MKPGCDYDGLLDSFGIFHFDTKSVVFLKLDSNSFSFIRFCDLKNIGVCVTLVIIITCTSAAAALFCVLLAARDFAVKAIFVSEEVEHKMMRMVVDDYHFVKSLMSFASVMGGFC
jgi:hypothetical protein